MLRKSNMLLRLIAAAFLTYQITSKEISTSDLATDVAIITSASSELPCSSEDPEYEHSLRITSDVKFFWKLEGDELKGSLRYMGVGWIGFGITDASGSMVGADAIIGNPDFAFEDKMSVLKYNIDSFSIDGVVPMEESMQTLQDSSVTQGWNMTVLSFSKLLKEDGEVEILSSGNNKFIWAVGDSNTFNQKLWGSFFLDLSNCDDDTKLEAQKQVAATMIMEADVSKGLNKKAFVIHGVLAAFAWCVCAPFAVATAWFRRLVPTGWIYMHVLANVTCFFMTLLAFIVAVVATGTNSTTAHFSKSHHGVGLVMMIFTTIQVMNGFMRPPIEKVSIYNEEPEGIIPRSPRAIWHAVHKCSGWVLIVLSIFQVKSGLTLYSELFGTKNILPIYWTTLGVFVISVLVIKLTMVCDLSSKDDINEEPREGFATSVEFSNQRGDDVSSLNTPSMN